MKKRISVFLVLMAVLTAVVLVRHANRHAAPSQVAWKDMVIEAEAGGYNLLSTEKLADHYRQDASGLLLVDTRQPWEYLNGHISGALNFPMKPTWWARWRKAGEMKAFLGSNKDRKLVFYGHGLARVRSDSAARAAVSMGYKNVYRYPYGFPEWQEKGLPIASSPSATEPVQTELSAIGVRSVKGWAMVWTLLGIFAGGLALNLTPCVYPMIPITVSFFGGRTARGKPSQIKLILHGICYLMGLAITNSTLGVVAALTGGLMGAVLQNPIVLTAVAGILVLFATSLFGFWELRLPGFLTQAAGRSYSGYFGSLFMGFTLGVVAAPCIGPFVLGLFTWVAAMGNPWLGFLIFFILSLGLGLPLFVLALFSGQLQRMPSAGGWMIWVRHAMGWVLVGMGAYFIRPVLPEGMKVLLPVVVVLGAGFHLGWLDKNQAGFKAFSWLKIIVGALCLILATFWITAWVMDRPGIDWQTYSEQTLRRASEQGKPVIIDIYAEWCAPCRELENTTFQHVDVIRQAFQDFVMIKIDVTSGGDPLHEKFFQQYGVVGVPTIIFLDASGKERTDLRLVDSLTPELFLDRMAAMQKSVSDH